MNTSKIFMILILLACFAFLMFSLTMVNVKIVQELQAADEPVVRAEQAELPPVLARVSNAEQTDAAMVPDEEETPEVALQGNSGPTAELEEEQPARKKVVYELPLETEVLLQ